MINWRKPIIYALLYLSKSKIPRNMREIERIDKLELKEKEEYQEEKLKKLLLHSYRNVPYYTKVLAKSKVIVNGGVYLENFNKIPILTKAIIRKEFENLKSKDYQSRKPFENTSGGSTGEPVRFIQDKDYNDWNNTTKIYFKTFGNQKVGDKELRLWGSERDLLEGKEKLSIKLRNWLYNRKEINSFKMSEEDMKEFVIFWNKFKPRWIEAYVQSIYEFTKFIKDNNLKIYSPKGILTSAGTLYPEMKKTIQEVFNCPVYNRYGSREVGGVACSDGLNNNLKVAFWHGLIEIERGNRKNDLGKIYITTLNNLSMPLIRYNIGDVGEIGENNLDIKRVVGRETDVFRTKEGKIIPAEFFIHFIGVVYNKGFITKFQVIQRSYNLIEVKAVLKDKEDFEKSRKSIDDSIKKVMGTNYKIKWTFVKDIAPTKSGKYLYTISEVK